VLLEELLELGLLGLQGVHIHTVELEVVHNIHVRHIVLPVDSNLIDHTHTAVEAVHNIAADYIDFLAGRIDEPRIDYGSVVVQIELHQTWDLEVGLYFSETKEMEH
jgi:hypothetical protein